MNLCVSLIFGIVFALLIGSILYGFMGLYSVDDFPIVSFFSTILMTLMVAESLNFLIVFLADDLIICVLISAVVFAMNSLTNGSLLTFK